MSCRMCNDCRLWLCDQICIVKVFELLANIAKVAVVQVDGHEQQRLDGGREVLHQNEATTNLEE